MDKYSKELAIVIITCDAYLDVMKEYMRYFHMNWEDCPFELIVVTETIDIGDERATCIIAGKKTTWTSRAITGIESTDCPYILMSMDDGFLSQKVSTKEVLEILGFVKYHDIKYYRNQKRKYRSKRNPHFDDRKSVYKIRKNELYGIDFGHNIWKREKLIEVLGDGSRSAWQIEELFNENALKAEEGFYEDMVSDEVNFLHIIETVSQGKWMPTEIKKLEKLGVPVNLGNREILPFSDTLKRKLHSIAYVVIPKNQRRNVKKIMSKFGYKFVTKY